MGLGPANESADNPSAGCPLEGSLQQADVPGKGLQKIFSHVGVFVGEYFRRSEGLPRYSCSRVAPSFSTVSTMEMMEEHMPRVLIPLIGLAMASAAALLVPRAEAGISAPASSVPSATSAVEQVRSVCVRRRVCGPHGRCAWKTVCRRVPASGGPPSMGPGMM